MGFKILLLPLELRRLIYGFCIPQNLTFNCSSRTDMYDQNRPKGWTEPSRYLEGEFWHYEGRWSYLSSRERDCRCGTSPDKRNGSQPPWEDPYCWICRGYRPETPVHQGSALPGLLVRQQITDEVETMLYGGNTFRVNLNKGLKKFKPRQRQKMWRVILVLRPDLDEWYYPHDLVLDRRVWDGVLENLVTLRIIITQPPPSCPPWTSLEYSLLHETPVEDPPVKREARLTPILKYVSRALRREVKVVMDANEDEATVRFVERVMQGRCHFQDLTFKRSKVQETVIEQLIKCRQRRQAAGTSSVMPTMGD
ncbi:hypothetical protein C8A01DRAFT_20042 [Parachaetomium inaequale]|uniref:Uncharacterized protein n=1 Tax=Parachaetomium inaequale TaxID=2588326 RepID=A0AAN6P744_9PEZI|nr:hypothetical protein C8A01DRAFT_20042 [Parachaetomium inaequale]